PWGQNLVLNRALAARRLAHSQRQISLYVSRPSAHVGWTGLFCRSQTRYWRKKDSILSKGMMSIRSYRSVWTAAGHFLGVKAGGLLLDGAEGPADGQGGQRARSPF